ncbi:DUF3046 domain-containing protein [soil metagenome]
MRHSEFWSRMQHHLGPAYAGVWAREQSLRELGGRSVIQALDEGEAPKRVWRAVWAALELPESQR